MRGGVPPDADAAMDIAERHRLSIDRWFYPCAPAMHRGLADMYEADARFAENIDKHGAGLTPYLSAAIRANAARRELTSRFGWSEEVVKRSSKRTSVDVRTMAAVALASYTGGVICRYNSTPTAVRTITPTVTSTICSQRRRSTPK